MSIKGKKKDTLNGKLLKSRGNRGRGKNVHRPNSINRKERQRRRSFKGSILRGRGGGKSSAKGSNGKAGACRERTHEKKKNGRKRPSHPGAKYESIRITLDAEKKVKQTIYASPRVEEGPDLR